MAVELSTPSFKPREYEGEKIEYLVYGLDDEGNEIECVDGPVDTPDSAAELAEDILEQFPGLYFHVTAVLNDENGKMKDSEVVWSNFPDDEAKGAREKLSYEKGHKNSKGVDAPWVIRSHKDDSVLASFPTKKEAENHMKTMKRYSKSEGRFTEIKAAIKAAWSAAEAKWFRLNFQESTLRLDVYPIASDNEGVGVNWGVLPERNTFVQYATDLRTGNTKIEREMTYKDLDELEEIFVDEFKSMDETLEVGAENGADIHPLTEGYTATKGGKSFPVDVTYNENPDDWRGNPVPDTYTIKVGEDSIEIDATELEKDCVRKGLRALGYTLNESRPTESEVDNFLHNALDWASIDDGENRIILKFIADSGKFALVGYDGRTQKTLTSGELFSVVDRFRELVEMDQADAIREFEKE